MQSLQSSVPLQDCFSVLADKAAMQPPRQTLATGAHDGVVIPGEQGPQQRRQQLHPGFMSADPPLVDDQSVRPLPPQGPAAAAFQFTAGHTLQRIDSSAVSPG